MKEISYTKEVKRYGFYKRDGVDPEAYEKTARRYIDAKFEKKQAVFRKGNDFEDAVKLLNEVEKELRSLSK